MELDNKLPIKVALSQEHWEKLCILINKSCKGKGREWEKWGDYITNAIHSNIGKRGFSSDETFSVTLSEVHWATVINIIEDYSHNDQKSQFEWVKKTIHIMHLAIENSKQNNVTNEDVKPEVIKVSNEAIEIFNSAWALWYKTDENARNEDLIARMISLISNAIGKAGAPYPEAHSSLAWLFLRLNSLDKAEYHAKMALSQNPNDFQAQSVKVDLARQKVHLLELRDVADKAMDSGGLFSAIVTSAVGAGFYIQARNTQLLLKDELLMLVKIFQKLTSEKTDANQFLYMARAMLQHGNSIKDVTIPGGKPNLFAIVATTSIEKIKMVNKEQEVRAILDEADGKSILFRP